ncbi:uncharacterized protein LOC118179706 [Stegodyphus dumicola]|uniref:uncharacterized protein LOC118179706 n=1 Tax=Stegodyphus dumicola TaxID=202533 RepID=UPI0015A83107|nr:uncharacterized protein LOC118179706 [Stegodyphus dumicola]
MGHVDALSRNPVCMVIQDGITFKIIQAQGTDENIKVIKEVLQSKPYEDYCLPNDVLYKMVNGIEALVVPEIMQIVAILADRGTSFTSQEFSDYCTKENIHLSLNTTGLPRANGQVERLNSIIISVISKLAIDDPTKWYKHVNDVQQIINSTFQRSINSTPFELLFGTKIKTNKDRKIKELIEAEIQRDFIESRENLRKEAKEQIRKIQEENRKTYNRSRKLPRKYMV